MKESSKSTYYCPRCKKEVQVTIKMWNTVVCNGCNTIISSNIGIDKAGK